MGIVIFQACLLMTYLIILPHVKEKQVRFKASFISCLILLSTFIAVSTEILSYFYLLRYDAMMILWSATGVLLFFWFVRVCKNRTLSITLFNEKKSLKQYNTFYICLFLIFLVEFFTAVISPPNNWDSMTYHMARVENWIQFNSVRFYPTSIIRQNYQMPFAEYVILHFQVLSGSDIFANLVQWFFMIGSVVAVTLITREFDSSASSQFYSAIIVCTIPMVILQSSSTQNDLVVSFFLLSYAYFSIRLVKTNDVVNAVFSGLSFGLALLTKGTAYIFALPIAALPFIYCATHFRKEKFVKTIKMSALIAAIGLLLNAGHLYRNYDLFGNPLSADGHLYKNGKISTIFTLSNVIRNSALHLMTPSDAVNSGIYKAVLFMLGDEIDNPLSTFPGQTFRPVFRIHEDFAGNTLHFLLIFSCVVFLPFTRFRKTPLIIYYVAMVLLAALLFCAVLKWQPWAVRLHLPLFLLIAPVIAIFLGNIFPRKISIGISLILLLCSLPFLLCNFSRPLIPVQGYSVLKQPRLFMYFKNGLRFSVPYAQAVEKMAELKIKVLGLDLHEDDWEYPIWVLIREKFDKMPSIYHVNISNITKKLQNHEDLPDAIFTSKNSSVINKGNKRFIEIWGSGRFKLLVREEKRVKGYFCYKHCVIPS